jgi:ubiquinone/menaquinone biosynthesis C-methylase UbiE
VEGSAEATGLRPGSVDLVFVCATYHHFEHPGPILESIHRALKPGGRLVVIDFDLKDDSEEFVRHHARAPKEVYLREIEEAGFRQLVIPKEAMPPLTDNFAAQFERLEQ